jgi:hypothetical protein
MSDGTMFSKDEQELWHIIGSPERISEEDE